VAVITVATVAGFAPYSGFVARPNGPIALVDSSAMRAACALHLSAYRY